MNCPFDKEKLTGYFDGELEAAEKAGVERHIAGCSECLRDLGEIKSTALLVKELPRIRAPRSIAEGVSREISSAGRARSRAPLRPWLFWTTAAAAGLFIAVNVVWFTGQKAPESPMARAPRRDSVSALGRTESVESKADLKEAVPTGKDELSARQEKAKAPASEDKSRQRLDDQAASGAPPAAAPAPAPVMTPPPAPAEEGALAKSEADAESRKKNTAPPAPEPFTMFSKLPPAEARRRLAEALKAIGVEPAESKDPTLSLELTEEQIVRLRAELEKKDDAKLLAGAPAASGGRKAAAMAPAKPAASKAAEAVDGVEAPRKIVIHLLEVKDLPAGPAPAKK